MKKFLYSLFILFFVFAGCKGSYSPVESDEVKLVNVKFTNDNARYVSYYQDNNNLKYEVTVYDVNGDFYKLYDEPPFPSYEEFLEIVKKNPQVLEMEEIKTKANEVISADEEELKSTYERLKSENSYYNSPYAFNIVLPEGKYTFVMEVYGTEEGYNKDVLLLKGETTAEIKQLSEDSEKIGSNYINIKLKEVETEIKTGNVSCYCSVNGVFESDYYFRYTTASDYEKNGNNSSWVTSKENQNLKITQTGDPKKTTYFSIKLCDLQPAKYIFQFVFTFKKSDSNGNIHEYVSYVSEIAEVCPGITITARFDTSTITQFGEVTLYSVFTDTNTVNPPSIQKYSYCNSFNLNSPNEYGYEFAGWYDDEACTKESNKVQYYCYSNQDYKYVYFDTYAALQEAINSGDYETSYYADVNNVENRCSGDFSLYAKMVKTEVVAEEDDPEAPYNPVIPEDEFVTISGTWILKKFQGQDLSNYGWTKIFDIEISDKNGNSIEISKPNLSTDYILTTYEMEGNYYQAVSLNYKLNRNLFANDLSTYIMTIEFYLQENGKEPELVDTVSTTLNNLDMLNPQEVEYTPATSGGGEYTITSTVKKLIDSNSSPSAGCVYSLSTEDELTQIGLWTKSNLSKGVTYVLQDNITLSSSSYNSIIGSGTSSPFDGIFDGNGKTITYNVNSSKSPSSLFDTVGSNDESDTVIIKNLTVCGSVSTSKDSGVIGGIVGVAFGKVIIDNCVSEVSVSGSMSSAAGGICGRVQKIANSCNVQIYNCINKGTVQGQNRVGGIIGDVADETEIFNCANIGKITFSGDTSGGLVGAIDTQDNDSKLNLLQNCYNMGEVSYTGTETNYSYGGIIGGESSSNDLNVNLLISNVKDCYWYLFNYNTPAVASNTTDIDGLASITNVESLLDLLNLRISEINGKESYCKNWKMVNIEIENQTKTYPLF